MSTNINNGFQWLFIPLLTGTAFALIRCVQNIQEIVKLKDDEASTEKNEIILDSCPEYWVKDTVYVPNTAGDGHVPIKICKNHNTFNKKKEPYFIAGHGKYFANTYNTILGTGVDSNLTNVLSKFNSSYIQRTSNVDDTTDTFTINEPSYFIENFATPAEPPHYDQVPVNLRLTRADIAEAATNATGDNPNGTVFSKNGNNRGSFVIYDDATTSPTSTSHIHLGNGNEFSGKFMGIHNHDDDYHTDGTNALTDRQFHTHAHSTELDYGLEYRNSANYEKNWVNSNVIRHDAGRLESVEINLDKLNTAENICDLAKHFYWIEAYNKCKYNEKNT